VSDWSPEAEAKLAALRRRYLASLPAKRRELAAAWAALAAGSTTDQALEHLRHLAHRLAGSAGLYGLPEISAAARSLEETTRSLLARSRAERSAHIAGLRELLEAVDRTLAARAGEPAD
jgi:HPt (histidine-containing phosphotransfer) domain-containing protein